MAEPSPGNGLSQKRGFTVSQTGFLFRLSSLRLGIEGVGGKDAHVREERRRRNGGDARALSFAESPSWPMVPQPWGLLMMAERLNGSLGGHGGAWGMCRLWSMSQGNRMKGGWRVLYSLTCSQEVRG